MSDKKKEAQADPMAEGSKYDHKSGVLIEPSKADEPEVRRHQVDPVMDPRLFTEANENPPIPRRGDPYAHQRDEKAAKASYDKEAKRDERDDEEVEAARRNNMSAAERARVQQDEANKKSKK